MVAPGPNAPRIGACGSALRTSRGSHQSQSIWANLLLVRHGESTCNEVNRFAGSADAPLSALGRAQAHEAAEHWSGRAPDFVYVSPLGRARETLDILMPAEQRTQPVHVEPRITERDLGEFTLQNKAELQRRLGIRGFDAALYGRRAIGGSAESFDVFRARVASFLNDTLVPQLAQGRRVLVVAHKYVIELLARLILDLPAQDAYDLRLPNAQVVAGDRLHDYCRRESRTLNRLRDWAVLHHEKLLALSALCGVVMACVGAPVRLHWSVGIALLFGATLISVMRVDLRGRSSSLPADWPRVLLRFALLPVAAGCVVFYFQLPIVWVCAALLLTAPTATTSVTLSRCAGGMVAPTVGAIYRSSLIGCLALAAVYQWLIGAEIWWLACVLAAIASATTFLPCALARRLRRRAPIGAGTWAERQSYLAVALLCIFVLFACSQIDPAKFLPFGLIALGLGLAIRLAARLCLFVSRLFATDHYLSLAYPNVFLVIILGQLLGLTELTQLATWYLLPMFLLTPLDLRICRRLQDRQPVDRLRAHLGIERDRLAWSVMGTPAVRFRPGHPHHPLPRSAVCIESA